MRKRKSCKPRMNSFICTAFGPPASIKSLNAPGVTKVTFYRHFPSKNALILGLSGVSAFALDRLV
ncbi:hypothetical protein CWS02_11560 [Enterobacter sp. EA-1]|nr:hypothetical protein CWS02_11560 [Enterobacter sp. EA-1]